MYQENYFIRHRIIILTITVLVFLAAGALIWFKINRSEIQPATANKGGYTDEQIQLLLKSQEATHDPSIFPDQQKKLSQSQTAAHSDTLTAEERQKLLESMQAPQK